MKKIFYLIVGLALVFFAIQLFIASIAFAGGFSNDGFNAINPIGALTIIVVLVIGGFYLTKIGFMSLKNFL